MESISIFKSVSSKNFSNASIKIIKPGGIEIPACVISPSEAPLPPARDTSFLLIFLKSRSNSISKFILSVFFSFLKSLKTKSETRADSSPDPSSAREISRGKAEILFPRKYAFRFAESELKPRHTARILGGQNPKEKCPFHFQKKSVARKSEKQGTFFFWVA